MTSIVNLERDMKWWTSSAALTANAVATGGSFPTVANMATDLVVSQRVASFYTDGVTTTASGNWLCAGVQMLPPVDGDYTPYRLIGGAVALSNPVVCVQGFYDAGAINYLRPVQFGASVDAVCAVPALDSADPLYGSPIVFGWLCLDVVAEYYISELSVMRMLSKPPQFASAVS